MGRKQPTLGNMGNLLSATDLLRFRKARRRSVASRPAGVLSDVAHAGCLRVSRGFSDGIESCTFLSDPCYPVPNPIELTGIDNRRWIIDTSSEEINRFRVKLLGGSMFRFRLRELLAEKEREIGQRIPLRELAEVTGVSVQVLSSLNSPSREIVTNTAALEAICRYFRCSPDRLLIFEPSLQDDVSCHIDELYPNRRR